MMRLQRPRGLDRRRFLLGTGGVALALPFLEIFGHQRARAAGEPAKRMMVFIHRQGTILEEWLPTGSETSFTLPRLLAPLTPWQDRIVVVSGLDNKLVYMDGSLSGHDGPQCTLLTAAGFGNVGAYAHMANGPSVEQVVASRIGDGTPFRSIDLAVGNQSAWNSQTISGYFSFAAANDPITSICHPQRTFDTLFAGTDQGDGAAAILRARRKSVLDAVLGEFNHLRGQVGKADRDRLDAHADKLRELETRLTTEMSGACETPSFSLPGDFDFYTDDPISGPLQRDMLAMAMACGMSRVGTLFYDNAQNPSFDWLNGGEAVTPSNYTDWHDMVHIGRDEEALRIGFEWYASEFASLLETLDGLEDEDGDNMLDTTMVLWATDFGNGNGHNTNKLPYVLAGNIGGGPLGRHVSYMNGGANDDWQSSSYSHAQLYCSILQAFGGDDEVFGHPDWQPQGVLPGLL